MTTRFTPCFLMLSAAGREKPSEVCSRLVAWKLWGEGFDGYRGRTGKDLEAVTSRALRGQRKVFSGGD